MMTDTEMFDQAHLQDVGENGRTVTQSLFDAAFVIRYLGNQEHQQKSFVTPKPPSANSGA